MSSIVFDNLTVSERLGHVLQIFVGDFLDKQDNVDNIIIDNENSFDVEDLAYLSVLGRNLAEQKCNVFDIIDNKIDKRADENIELCIRAIEAFRKCEIQGEDLIRRQQIASSIMSEITKMKQ